MAASKVISMDLEKYVEQMKRMGYCKESRTDYICMCPDCKVRHHNDPSYRNLKLYIDKDLQYGRCFVCNLVVLSDDQSIHTGIKSIEPKIDMSNWSVCKLGDEGYWSLSRFKDFDEDDPIGVEYLTRKRLYIYKKMYKLLGIKFKDHNPVVPFYYKGELVYYQMRIIDPNSKMKYYSPHTIHKNPYILEHGDNKKFVICEGTFDAIACRVLFPDRTPFAVLGSDITDYQIAMLRSYCPEDILVYMDKTDLSRRIKDRLMEYVNYADININPSDGTDPEEYLKVKLLINQENCEYD